MSRTVGYLIKVTIAVAIAVWLADRPGAVTIDWQGWRLETTVGMLALIGFLVVIAAALAYRLWRAVVSAPHDFGEMRRGRRRIAGYRALTQGMVAVAAGEVDEAKRLARRADHLLDEPPLTLLLAAQAEQLGGDEDAATRYFTAMLDDPETEFLGLRGLLTRALRDGDTARGLELAARAEKLRPGTTWARDALFQLNSRLGNWDAALQVLLPARVRAGTAGDTPRHLAAVLTARARDEAAPPDVAMAAAEEARRLDAALVPAVDTLARRLAAAGKTRRARKLLLRAWPETPHPDLVAAYLEVVAPAEPLAAVRAVEKLCGGYPDHRESRLARAAVKLDAGLWGPARAELAALDDDPPEARVCRLMARLEDAEDANGKGAEAARGWLARLADAAPDPVWQCGDCGAVARDWAAVCGHCGAVASLGWQPPQRMEPLRPLAVPAAEESVPEIAGEGAEAPPQQA